MPCVHCKGPLPKGKIKYCSDRCAYWFKQIQNDKPAKFSKAQHLRMSRAGVAQRKGRLGVRFN